MSYIQSVLDKAKARNENEPEFIQAIEEMFESIESIIEENPMIEKNGLLERMIEPDRQIIFRISWVDDAGKVQVIGF